MVCRFKTRLSAATRFIGDSAVKVTYSFPLLISLCTKCVVAAVGEFKDFRYVHDYDYLLRVLSQGFKAKILPDTGLFLSKLASLKYHSWTTVAVDSGKYGDAVVIYLGLSSQLTPLVYVVCKFNYEFMGQSYTHEEWQSDSHLTQQGWALLMPLIRDRDAWISERDTD